MSTICAISTAPGVGGIAVIRVSGPDAFKICDRIFRPKKAGKSLSTQKAYTLTYGSIVGNNDETIDEVIAAVFRAPHSFTGEDTVEITCHGSTYIQQQILQSLISSGCRIAQPGEYTQRAFMNGKMDLSQAEAVADLIASTSAGQHRLALSQMRGGFSKELTELRNKLLNFTSMIELELDFSEEDVEFADRSALRKLADEIEQVISRLAHSFSVGNAIKNGVPVAIIGETNAGKSTLLASVSAAKPKIANYPFTTLEPNLGIVSYRDSKSFVMADIPGIIEGASAGKGLGLRFLRHIERNSLLLFMVPADSDDIRKEYEILLNELSTFNPEMLDKQRVLAITKSDMLDQELMDEIEPTLPANVPHVFISSITGMGLSVLKDILWEELNKDSNKIEAIVHRPKDVNKLQQELKDMGEDEDLSYEYVEDDEDVEDLEDFEYEEEDWEDDKQ